jgi:ligand-binding sensor domain-containing protein
MKLNPSFIIFFLSVYFSHSQTYIYKNFSVDEGLPSSEVYDIYQDKLGYIWFATDKGLSRYNGYEFENFTTKDGLPGNTILDFYPQDNGKVYCYEYHSKSLFYFNTKFDGFQN